jgi:hypothetical protein
MRTNLVPVTTVPWVPYVALLLGSMTPAGGNVLPSTRPIYPNTAIPLVGPTPEGGNVLPSTGPTYASVVSGATRSGISLSLRSISLILYMAFAALWF